MRREEKRREEKRREEKRREEKRREEKRREEKRLRERHARIESGIWIKFCTAPMREGEGRIPTNFKILQPDFSGCNLILA
jgi:hypothetical protein